MSPLESGLPTGGRKPALVPGAVLASRYRIAAFLGQGAVGQVYEAEDLELGERLAVKILHPEIAGDERVLRRFKREIQLGRKITHPNVCRVFDLVPSEAGAFLTMELLRGETLEQRLARQGRMSTAEALPVIGHVAAALAAAHACGVVHRDLKSGNVFLVPAGEGGPGRAVVTDFGLAWSRLYEEVSEQTALTATGELVGSPAYMAPEQVRGEEATPATDVYALGVVMFEMITGELPFVGKSAFYTALKRLQEPAPSPRVHRADLDPAWERTILRCLERDPAARFPTVRHVVRSLGATKAEEDATSPLTLFPPRRARRRRMALWTIAGGLVVAAGLGLALRREPAPPPPSPASAPSPAAALRLRTSVAVLPFTDLSAPSTGNEADPVLFELLPVELAATGKLRLVPPGEVERAVRDLGAENPGLGRRLRVDFLVSGAYLPNRYEVLVLEARSGRQVASLTEPAGPDLLDHLGERLRAALGAGALSSKEEEALRATLPHGDAARPYAEGLRHLHRFEAPAARGRLAQAAALDPDRAVIHGALAAAWRDLGDLQKAREAARKAFALTAPLRWEDRLALQALYHEISDEIPEAVDTYRKITTAVPDDLETGVLLVQRELRADLGADAQATLKRLCALPSPVGDDPRLAVYQSQAAGVLRDFPRQKTLAEKALRGAEAWGDRELAIEGRLSLGEAQIWLQELDAAERTFEQGRQEALAIGQPDLLAQSLKGLGLVRYRQGRLDAMENAFQELIGIYRRIGAEGKAADGLKQVANLYMGEGKLDRAEAFYRQAQEPAHRLGDRRLESSVLHNLASNTWRRGRLKDAKALFRQALALHREIGYAKGEAASLQGIGTISKSEGDLLTARKSFQEALAVYRRMGDEKSVPEALNNLAEVSLALGELEQSRQEREQARAAARAARLEHEEARAGAGLAEILYRQGDLAAARQGYEESRVALKRLNLPVRVADTEDDLGVVLTAQGDLVEALKRFQHALAVVREGDLKGYEAQVLTHQGRALGRWGELARARAVLEEAIALSRKVEEPSSLAEARLALGDILIAQGDLQAARRSFDEAHAIYRDRGEPSGTAAALCGLGDVSLGQRDFETARRRHQESLAIRSSLGEKLTAAESRVALGRVALAEGGAPAAEAAAREALDAFRRLGNAPGQAEATILLLRALLAQGSPEAQAEARQALKSAEPLFEGSQEPAVRGEAAKLRLSAAGAATVPRL